MSLTCWPSRPWAPEYGGDEDTAIAALLHDAVEDQGGLETRDEIEGRFGGRVAGIVMACTDSAGVDPGAKAPRESRKRHHIEKLRSADRDVALVTAADNPHNRGAVIRDVRRHGPATLERFNLPGRLAWYYRGVADALGGHEDLALVGEMRERIGVLEGLLGDGGGALEPAKRLRPFFSCPVKRGRGTVRAQLGGWKGRRQSAGASARPLHHGAGGAVAPLPRSAREEKE